MTQRSIRRIGFLRRRRSGVYTSELLLTTPVFMVFLLAVVQFGMFFSNVQQLALASRVGAEAASEGTIVITSLESVVQQHLNSCGISNAKVRLEHDIAGSQVVTTSTGWTSNCEPTAVLASPFPPGGYVRVSVCVPLTEMMPNLLVLFGFDISDPTDVISSTTVMHFET